MPKTKIKRLYLIPILSKALDVIELLEQNHAPVALEDVYPEDHTSPRPASIAFSRHWCTAATWPSRRTASTGWFRALAACVSALPCRARRCPFPLPWRRA